MNFKGINRGIIRNRKKFFKNTINLDISTTLKNINLKLSPEKIKLCGAVSKENGLEAVHLILNHLKNIKCYMEEIHFIDYNRIINIIHNQFTGRPLLKHCVETVMTNNGNFNIHTYKNDYDINTQVDLMIDEKLDQYIKSLSNDMIYHSDYDNKLKNLLNFKPVYTDDIHIEQINEVMVNYNYNLGFKINRDMLNNLIDGKYGFVSNYDNALVN